MSRTFRKDDSGRRPEDTRRNKRREKSNSHWSMPDSYDDPSYRKNKSNKNYRDFELDTDMD
jgi:hypothetical protein